MKNYSGSNEPKNLLTHIEILFTANGSLPHSFIQAPCLQNPINNFIQFYKLVGIQIIDSYFYIIRIYLG